MNFCVDPNCTKCGPRNLTPGGITYVDEEGHAVKTREEKQDMDSLACVTKR